MTETARASTARRMRRLERYLRERAADGEFYFKSKFVADDLGMTPKQVGTLVARLQESTTVVDIERWGYSDATTWHVTPR